MFSRIVRCLSVLFLLTVLAGQSSAGVLSLDYSTLESSPGVYQYDFELKLTNQDGTFSPGDDFNWIIFGDVSSGNVSPIADFSLLSTTLPAPFMFVTSSGGHNGPTFLASGQNQPGWIPTGIGDSVTWSGTSSNLVASGLQFSTLTGSGTLSTFQDANLVTNAVPEPSSVLLFGMVCGMGGMTLRKRR